MQENTYPQNQKPKVLIFTSKTGGGHISLSEALRDRLEERYAIEMVDPQPGIIHLHYRLVSRHALWLWATEFQLADTPLRSRMAHRSYSLLLSRYVTGALRSVQPDLVITTYPFLTCEVTHAMKRIGRRVPFAMLFADPNGVHHSWLTERGADAVFAPTRETYHQALAAGFPTGKLHLAGWPVRAQFYRTSPISRNEMLAQLGLDPQRFTVFLQGGGEGAAKFARTVENVLAVSSLQVILATGTNKKLYEQFQHSQRVHALPFTKEIAKYMGAADVVMGKAGPNMLFEAITLGKPFIATAYIPGQEKVNLEFIQRHKLGWVALDPRSQQNLVRSLSTDPTQMREIQASVDIYRQWNSASNESIVPLVEHLLQTAAQQVR